MFNQKVIVAFLCILAGNAMADVPLWEAGAFIRLDSLSGAFFFNNKRNVSAGFGISWIPGSSQTMAKNDE